MTFFNFFDMEKRQTLNGIYQYQVSIKSMFIFEQRKKINNNQN